MAGELLLINPRRKRRRVSRVRRNPRRRRVAALAGPSPARRTRRRRGGFRRRVSRYARSGAKRFSRAARRSFSVGGFVRDKLIPGSIGAGGALALDVAMAAIPFPDFLTTGIAAPLTRLAGAVGIGYGARAIAGRRVGDEVMAGAIIVTLYSIFKEVLKAQMPNLPLGVYTMGWPNSGPMVGAYADDPSLYTNYTELPDDNSGDDMDSVMDGDYAGAYE